MSLCFRSLPSRLSSLVSGRKPLSKLDHHHLQKHVSSSAFLKQFLGTQRALSIRANTESKLSLSSVNFTLHQNLLLASLNTSDQRNKKLVRQYNGSESVAMCWTQDPCRQYNRLQKLALSRNKKHSAAIRTASDNNITVFQTQSVEGDKNTMFLDNSRLISSGSLHNSRESNSSGILFTSNNTSILKAGSQSSSPSPQDDDKPSQDKLQHVVDGLTIDLTNLFTKPQNYTMYTKNMVFVNNIRGVTTVGVGNYAKQMILLRMIGHLKFAYVKCDIVKITMHPEDGTIKVRWRIRGVTGFRMFFSFWKYKIWKIRDAIDKDHELWYDGFSTYYVNGEGKIYKHIADKMMPDQDVTKKEDLRIAAKLALFASLANMFDSDNFSKLNSNLKLH